MPSSPSTEEAKRWAIQAANGLGVIHDCGIIQGDGQNNPSVFSIPMLT
jgi:hypothetical protein